MCGIVGIISKQSNGFTHDDCNLFTRMLQMDSVRGDDSTGVFGVNLENRVDLMKADTDGWRFTQSGNYYKFKERMFGQYRIVIGHNRSATKGSINANNAHPFKDEHITLVHNGTIYNQEDLAEGTEVDSHAITKALAKNNAKEALNQIHGAFALVWFDSKHRTLNLARNNERPLFLLNFPDCWLISSEVGLPWWLMSREGKKPVTDPLAIPLEKIVQFDLDNLKNSYITIDYDNYEYYVDRPKVVVLPAKQDPVSTGGFKQGDSIKFKIDDIKHELGDRDWVIFGHPLINNIVDSNIIIKTAVSNQTEADALKAAGFGIATITALGMASSMPIYFARFPAPVYTDQNQSSITEDEFKTATAKGCQRCQTQMSFADVAKSIIRKKANGDYRVICSTCILTSRNRMEAKKNAS